MSKRLHGQTDSTANANRELQKSRNIADALAAALLGEYPRSEALAQWAADLDLNNPDNKTLVDKLKGEGVPVDKWAIVHNIVEFRRRLSRDTKA
jgi:hypothetical protein